MCHGKNVARRFFFQIGVPSGKHTTNYGKSPFFMGKSTISTGPFSIAFCMFTRPGNHQSIVGFLCRMDSHWTDGAMFQQFLKVTHTEISSYILLLVHTHYKAYYIYIHYTWIICIYMYMYICMHTYIYIYEYI